MSFSVYQPTHVNISVVDPTYVAPPLAMTTTDVQFAAATPVTTEERTRLAAAQTALERGFVADVPWLLLAVGAVGLFFVVTRR